MDVSVIIVNYKTRDITLQCLRSLFQNTSGVEMEVIVVDNASGDATPQYIHQELVNSHHQFQQYLFLKNAFV